MQKIIGSELGQAICTLKWLMEKETQQVRSQLTLGLRDAQLAPPELKAGKGEERILSRPARAFLTGEWISRQSSV